jgi:PAS domain S-box-containing protein
MTWQTIFYFSSIFITCLLTGFLSWYAWRMPGVAGIRTYAWMVLGGFLMTLAEILSMLSGTQAQALFWFNLRFIFITAIPVLWLIFVVEYSGRKDWLSKKLWAGMFVIPLITQGMIWSNSLHGLWVKQDVTFHQSGSFWIAETSARIPGLWFLVHVFYSLILMLVGMGLMLFIAWHRRHAHRTQALLLSAAALIGLITSLLPIFNFLAQIEFNLFIPGFGVSTALYALAIFQFLKHSPVQENTLRMTRLDAQEKQTLAIFILIFGLLVSGSAAVSIIAYRNYEEQFIMQVKNLLSSIGALKTAELQDWRNERLADANLFYQNRNFSERVQKYLENPADADAQRNLLTWMEKVQSYSEYDRIFLLDPQGVERVSIPNTPEEISQNLIKQASISLDSRQIVFMDFHRHSDSDTIHMSMVVPIFTAQDQPLGALVLRINPDINLNPFIQRWPVPSQSAETLLVRRDGNDVLYLNELKFEQGAALNRRISLKNENITEVKALLGVEGSVEGVDYRGVHVIADVRAVSGSPWFLISKMDTAEVYAPLQARLWQTIVVFGMLILLAGAGLALTWRQEQTHYLQLKLASLDALQISERKFRLAFDTSPDAIAISRLKDGMYVTVNRSFERISGYSRDEIIGKTSLEINIWKDPADRQKIVETLQTAGQINNYDATFLTPNGEIQCLMSAAIIELNGEPHILNIARDITERQQAQDALYKSRAELRALLDAINESVFLMKPDGTVTAANETTAARLGKRLNDLVDHNVYNFLPNHVAEARRAHVAQVIASGQPVRFEDERYDKWIDNSIFPVKDETGRVTHLAVYGSDITERKRAEDALRKSEALYRAILNASPDDITITDLEGRILMVSHSAVSMFGYEREDELLGHLASDFIAPEDRERALSYLGTLTGPLEYRGLRKDGSTFDTEINVQFIPGPDGQPTSMIFVVRDITKRKQAEAMFRKLSSAVEQSPVSIVITDLLGNIEYVNPRFSQVTGYSLEEAIKQNPRILKSGNTSVEEYEKLWSTITSGNQWQGEFLNIKKNGETYWENATIAPVFDANGKVTNFLAIKEDITERKQAEQALHDSQEELNKAQHYSHVGSWTWNIKTNQLKWSDEMYHIFGISKAAFTGNLADVIAQAIHPDDRDKVEQSNRSVSEQGKPIPLEYRIVRPDGTIRVVWGEAGELILDNNGNPSLLSGIVKDITERRRAEEELLKSEQKYRLLFDEMMSAVAVHEIICDKRGKPVDYRFMAINTAFEKITGLHAATIIGKTVLEVMPATELYWIERYGQVALTRTPIQFENYASELDKYFEVRAFSPEHGKFATIFNDITERKKAEIEIKERTEDLELINALNESANRGDSLEKILGVFTVALQGFSACNNSTIYLLSPDRKNLVMQTPGLPQSLIKKIEQLLGRRLPQVEIPIQEDSFFQRALQAEQGIITTDPRVIQNWMQEFTEAKSLPAAIRGATRKLIPQIYKLLDIRSTMVIPLFSDNKAIGLLDISSSELMTEKDLQRIRKISGQLTPVILREQANEALLESEERYRSIFDGVQDAIFVETKDGGILEVNNRACEMYGYPRDEFLSKKVADLVPEGSTTFTLSNTQSSISHIPFETFNRRASGEIFPIEISGGALSINGEEVLLVLVRDITEHKQAEEELARSHDLLEKLTRLVPGVVYQYQLYADGRSAFPYSSPGMNGIYEVTPEEVQEDATPVFGRLHPDDYDRVSNTIQESANTLQTFYCEYRVILPRQGLRWRWSQAQPERMDDGSTLWHGIISDITERKQAEEAIQQRMTELKLLYENSLVFSQLLSPKEVAQKIIELLEQKMNWHHITIRLANEKDKRLELLALDQRGLEGNTGHGTILANLNKAITSFSEGLSGWALEQSKIVRSGDVSSDPHYEESYPGVRSGLYVPLKSGERRIGVISIESEKPDAFSEADEQLISTLANQAAIAFENARLYEEVNRYTEELEERVQERTAEIEATRQRLELAVQTAGIGIWEVDIEKNVEYWDDRLFSMYGLSSQTSLPEPETWHKAIHPDDLNLQKKVMEDSLHNQHQPYSTEFRVVWPDASIHYIKSTGAIIRDAAGVPERMIGANQDITLHKQAEETLIRANAEMERGLRMKNEFLANMSHELRTPLNAILGISESLEEQISGKLNEKQLKYIHTVIESGRHLLELINDILDLSKIEAGKLELNIQTIPVEKLCTSSLRLIRELAQKKALNVSLKIDEKVQFITGDERRLKQSLVNLLGNAVKFTPQGKNIGLEVKGNAQTNEITFTVWDEGIGIEQEDIEYLFQPFVQLNAGLAREFAGTGLGLALVAQMVHLHGGRIDLTSELQAGSRFTITLPWLPKEQAMLPTVQAKALNDIPMPKAIHTGKILIVEDTEVVAQLMSEYLQHQGYETIIARNGQEGVMLARQELPQLILMDVMMPIMNGLDATKHIRADAAISDIPIIGLTALAMSSDREECIAAGMNDHLSKPIQMQDLVKIIEHHLNKNR